ncbi:uncharacterized protein N7482_003813 [Penicillium canariense]|uniref:Uncharacterized protein n=1 Tax=Penicillium canariense TaxID=189055 RepID=A0A9W9LNT0_9EURO|nr:uncharacterized protein N7482_003813 [Penicillium canariense]KAJ5168219.1 hypothetical protein N7482_003813 [Penicillium canariense]
MSPPRSWFRQGPMRPVIEVGKVIKLSHPQPSKWRICEVLHEYDLQRHENAPRPSYTSILLSGYEIGGSRRPSMMRVVVQIPSIETQLENSTVRAKEATSLRTSGFRAFLTFTKEGSTFTPPLLGYLEDGQDRSGLVPGGYITYYAWEVVPGIRLGDDTGKASLFWTLDEKEREEIRDAFRDTFVKITSMRVWPDTAGAPNLVWNSKTKTLTWVGFRDCDVNAKPSPWKDLALPLFDLVKAPNNLWLYPDWNGETSEWKY